MLLFKQKFLEAIKGGTKTQTIRLWQYRRMRAGQRSYIAGIGYIRIESVERVELDQLTDDDAKLDGFKNADALREEIRSLYDADALARLKAFKIRFSVLPSNIQQAITEEQNKKREAEKNKRRLFQHFGFQ